MTEPKCWRIEGDIFLNYIFGCDQNITLKKGAMSGDAVIEICAGDQYGEYPEEIGHDFDAVWAAFSAYFNLATRRTRCWNGLVVTSALANLLKLMAPAQQMPLTAS